MSSAEYSFAKVSVDLQVRIDCVRISKCLRKARERQVNQSMDARAKTRMTAHGSH